MLRPGSYFCLALLGVDACSGAVCSRAGLTRISTIGSIFHGTIRAAAIAARGIAVIAFFNRLHDSIAACGHNHELTPFLSAMSVTTVERLGIAVVALLVRI